MIFIALIVVFALTGMLFSFAAVRRLRRRKVVGGLMNGATALILMSISVFAVLIAGSLHTYERLSFEQPAGELQLARIGDREFNVVLTYPSGQRANFALRGDEWQVDARVLKWHAFANIVGFDTAYRLERISGRYTHIEDERSRARTVYSLQPAARFDPWDLIHRHHSWLPWIDALYGSAAFLPMADGALYEVKVSQSGLIARPLNHAARDAVGSWHQ